MYDNIFSYFCRKSGAEIQCKMLVLEQLIVDTHSDFSPWAEVNAGFLDDRSFVVELVFEGTHPDYRLLAIVSPEDAQRMAGRLGVGLTQLPKTIYDHFGEEFESPESTGTHVENVFNDILNFVISHGAHYRIRKELIHAE